MHEDVKAQLAQLMEPMLSQLHVEIVEINIKAQKNLLVIEVLADKEKGGITIEECTQLNRFIHDQLEAQPIIESDFQLEVSSPGLDRPLRTLKDFARVIGKDVRFHLSDLFHQKREHHGTVLSVEEDCVIFKPLATKKDKQGAAEPFGIPYNLITKAVQII